MPKHRRRPRSGDAWGRIIRGFLQAGTGAGLVQGIDLFFPGLLSPAQATWLTAGLAWLASVVQNGLEAEGLIKPILKGPAEPDEDDLTAAEVAELRAALASRERS